MGRGDVRPETEMACLLEACEDGIQLDLTLDDATIEKYSQALVSHVDLWRERTLACGGIFLQVLDSASLQHSMAGDWVSSGLLEPRQS